MRQRVVVVEDEPDIVELVTYNFQKNGFDVKSFPEGRSALEYLREASADLVILDVMLPDMDGKDVCRTLRADPRLVTVPVIFLTARGEEVDRILGLELGADDYVVKPFSPRELVARARAVLRRHGRPDEPQNVIQAGGLRLDALSHDVFVDGQHVTLSALEFRLLHFLVSHPRRIFTRDHLLDEVWGLDRSVTPRTVDVHIRRLREKIEREPDQPVYIHTVRGAGYRFEEPQEER